MTDAEGTLGGPSALLSTTTKKLQFIFELTAKYVKKLLYCNRGFVFLPSLQEEEKVKCKHSLPLPHRQAGLGVGMDQPLRNVVPEGHLGTWEEPLISQLTAHMPCQPNATQTHSEFLLQFLI